MSRMELPWAVPKREGFEGKASGLYFHFYKTRAEAEKTRRWLKQAKKYTGPVEYRPGECYHLGWVGL